MKQSNTLSLFFCLLIALCACTKRAGDPDDIRGQYDAWNVAFGNDDLNATLAFYTDDAMRLPSDGSMIKGMATIQDAMAAFREENDYVLDDYSPPQIQISGDLAVTYSTFDEHWTSHATGELTQESGSCLVEWKRQSDGKWKISKEMCTSAPATSAAVQESIEELMMTLSDRWSKVALTKDTSYLSRIWAPDFFYIRADGSTFNKAEGIAGVDKDTDTYTDAATHNFHVRVYNSNFAVTTGEYRAKGRDRDGKAFARKNQFTSAWVKKNGIWQCVAGHASGLK